MTGKPINEILTRKVKFNKRQLIWNYIREVNIFTKQQVFNETGIHEDIVRAYAYGLVKSGFLKKIEDSSPVAYELIKDVGIDAPRVSKKGEFVKMGQVNQSLWNTIRRFNNFNIRELTALAFTDELKISYETTKKYLQSLHKAGYLIKEKDRYKVILGMIKGPKAPQIGRLKTVFDPNIRKIVFQEEVKDNG